MTKCLVRRIIVSALTAIGLFGCGTLEIQYALPEFRSERNITFEKLTDQEIVLPSMIYDLEYI